MTSQRQRQANRKNAQRSTGPKSGLGKSRSKLNAYRHGLSLPVADFRDAEVLDLAAKLSPSAPLEEWALIAAEAHIRVNRIRALKLSALNSKMPLDPELTPQARLGLALNEAADETLRLNQYERKALSRRRKALLEAN